MLTEVFNSINNWILQDGREITSLGKLIKVIIIFVSIRILIKVSHIVIDKFFNREKVLRVTMEERKAKTLSTIIKSLFKYLIYFIGLVIVLDIFGIPTASILATAGVGGIAVGFGAQSLVKDIITGFFILFEDYFSVGDYVQTGGYDGIVEDIGIRSTRIRGFSGELHIIPNGFIDIVTNSSRGDMRAWVDVRINYREDINRALEALETVAASMSDDENINCGPTVLGVTNLAKDDIVLSVQAMTKPMEQWDVGRKLRKEIKEEFERRNIPISDFRRVIYENEIK